MRHVRNFGSASQPSARGRPPLLAVRWPRATGLTSDLSGCPRFTSQRCGVSRIAGVLEVSSNRAATRLLPGPGRSFCPPFGGFGLAGQSIDSPPERLVPCWLTVATVHSLLSDCDSPGLETSPCYLTRLGTVSHRSWPLDSFFACRQRANAAGGIGESCLLHRASRHRLQRG